MIDVATPQNRDGMIKCGILIRGKPQHSRLMKELLACAVEQLFPLTQRFLRPARVDFVRTVAHANNARLAARAGACVCRAKCFDEYDALFPPGQMQGSPAAEYTGADHSHIKRLACHKAVILTG